MYLQSNNKEGASPKLLLTSPIPAIPLYPWELEDEYKKFMEIQKERKLRADEVCKKYDLSRSSLKEVKMALVADIDEKFIFCNNYKVSVVMGT